MFADGANLCATVLRLSEKRCAVKTQLVMSLSSVGMYTQAHARTHIRRVSVTLEDITLADIHFLQTHPNP